MRNFLFILAIIAHQCHAHRYLFVSINIGHSHLAFDGKLADVLVERGHEVDFVVMKMNTFVNGNGSKLANVVHYTPKSIEKLNELTKQIPFYLDVFKNEIDLFAGSNMGIMKEMFSTACFELLGDTEFSIRSRQYDGAFAEMLDGCSLSLFKLIGIKNVMITSPTALFEMNNYEFGLPALPSFIPVLNQAPISPLNMNFFERTLNFYYTLRSNYVTAPAFAEIFDRPGRLRGTVLPLDFPLLGELRKDITTFFVNSNELLDLPRPIISKLKQIGGIAINKPNTLDKKTAKIFEIARKGVVLLSFGSIVNTQDMNVKIRDAFLNSFSQFPEYEFIWKYDGSMDIFKNYSNIHPINWLDQTAILNNPKTKAFISHVGLNSLNEAAQFGVPILAIPFFGDQTYNAAMMNNLKIGIPLSKRNISVETLTSTLRQLLAEDNEFLKRAKTISKMLNSQLNSPAEKFVHQVEFATEFPEELKCQRIPELNLFVYYSLDVISFLLLISLIPLFIVLYVLKKVISFFTVNLKVKTL